VQRVVVFRGGVTILTSVRFFASLRLKRSPLTHFAKVAVVCFTGGDWQCRVIVATGKYCVMCRLVWKRWI